MLSRDLNKWDSSGVGHTCSNIDKVISHLEHSEDPDARDFIDHMERIRSDNTNLREHGAQLNWDTSDRIEELEEEKETLISKISDLEDTIVRLEDDIERMQYSPENY